jgi:hypothetical protein
VLSGEATNTNFIVFGLTQPGLEPTTYSTRGEHANHYTTNAVILNLNEFEFLVFYATFSNISAISWQPVLVVEEAGVPRENYRISAKT